MAIQYQQARSHPEKNKFMTIRSGYHGDTTGAMSVCDPQGGMHHLFAEYLPRQVFTEQPSKTFEETYGPEDFNRLEQDFRLNAGKCTAFILEPIVQGAGGMWFYSPSYLKRIRELCNEYDMLLITDEIATGFGRTGKLFAVEHANIEPDIMCVGKALTGGYMTLAATLTSEHVAETVCNGEAGVFMHGPTFMGNPLACTVANKSLELLLNSNWCSKIESIEKQLKKELLPVANALNVKDVRVLGAIGVVEMKEPIDVPNAQKFFVERGVWIRPFRNLIYIMPPFVIESADLRALTQTITQYVEREM